MRWPLGLKRPPWCGVGWCTFHSPLISINIQTHASSTSSSLAVSHPSIVLAQCCLTSGKTIIRSCNEWSRDQHFVCAKMSLRLLNCKARFKTFLSFQDRGMTSAVSQNGTPTWPQFLIFFSPWDRWTVHPIVQLLLFSDCIFFKVITLSSNRITGDEQHWYWMIITWGVAGLFRISMLLSWASPEGSA